MWTSQKSSTVSLTVRFLIQYHTGALASCRGSNSSTVSVCWMHSLYHVSAHLPTCFIILMADTSSSSHPCCSVVVNHAREHVNIQCTCTHGAFQDVHGSWEPGCDKRRVNDTQIHTIIPCAGAVVMINVGLAQARPKYCNEAKFQQTTAMDNMANTTNLWKSTMTLNFLMLIFITLVYKQPDCKCTSS